MLTNFIHFRNSCTRNRDYHILLKLVMFKKKESCHKLLLVFVREKGLNTQTKNDGCFHNCTNKLYSGKPISRFGAAPFLFIFVEFSSLAALLVLFPE